MTHQTPRIVVTGHVDHGKSTLIGRLLHDTGNLPDGKAEEVQKLSETRGLGHIEWSYVLDAFKAERDQAVTIDTTQISMKLEGKPYTLIDAPGHREFLKNMLSGASQAEAAILVLDAAEGLGETTRTHAVLLELLGMRDIIVAINKVDLIDYAQDRFEELSAEILAFLTAINLPVKHIVPVAARDGDGLATHSDKMQWYDGPCLVDIIKGFEPQKIDMSVLPARFPVQDVVRSGDERIFTGRLESGALKIGDEVMLSHQNETARIVNFENWPEPKDSAEAGQCIGFTLDRKLFIERGSMLCDPEQPPKLLRSFGFRVFWLSEQSLKEGQSWRFRVGTDEAMIRVSSIDRVIDLAQSDNQDKADKVERFELAYVTLHSKRLLSLDSYSDNLITGRGVLVGDDGRIVGGGQIDVSAYPDRRDIQRDEPKSSNLTKVDHLLSAEERAERTGHKSGVFWFTGLSGAGKSTLAMRVEQALFDEGFQTYVLDGDNVRHGLNKDLGFAPEDRVENIRRVGEVASLIADSGSIVMTSFISPYRADRQRARECSKSAFHEIYIKADVETCEGRDPKGLYKKARAGEIKQFTGIDAPYEEPDAADLVVDTNAQSIEESVALILKYVKRHVR